MSAGAPYSDMAPLLNATGSRPHSAGLGNLISIVVMGLVLIEAAAVFIALRAALPVPAHGLTFDPALRVFLFGLPLLSAVVLAKHGFYSETSLLFTPVRPLALIGSWTQTFGAATILAAMITTEEPFASRLAGLNGPSITRIFCAGLLALIGIRIGWALLRPHVARLASRRVIFFGALDRSTGLIAKLRAEPGIQLVQAIDCGGSQVIASDIPVAGVRDAQLDNNAASLAHGGRIDAVVVALPQMAEGACANAVALARQLHVDAVAVPDCVASHDLPYHITNIGRFSAVRLASGGMTRREEALKRAGDIVMGCCFFLIIAPVMLVIAAMIRLDSPGPVLFRQPRVGKDGRIFNILKFRTMAHVPADAARPAFHDDLQTCRDDKRITSVGAFLRRHSFDELPQIFNVLRGDMSVIGPRPHACAMTVEGAPLEVLVPEYPARLVVRPGITGWAQINGQRGMLDNALKLQDRVDHDIFYIENWSMALDLHILARTVICICFDNAAF